ncbi:HAMP domain-containing histidine kinase [Luteimonas sp. 50]|uniref:histidine kinase n=1 Tax=Cognatiluteimonas sedimenti TaxID=2927791 RepID=A0ABT0A376_9GAMM|nr:HAMP domain-containing sensor histidine kinase [Lysobacter sedimenti]MCJ0825438.1 HAMP domain-containing histidine kinase [Lysobacter sedimenti]
MPQGLPRKLRFAFMLQVAMASIVILAGTWASVTLVKHELARRALQDEAAYFWMRRAGDPAHAAPDGRLVRGYAVAAGASAASLPPALRGLEPGLYDLQDTIVLVDQRDDIRLYLTSPRATIDLLSLQMVLAPMLLALLALAASAWFTYRNARKLVSPLHWMAREVQRWDPLEPETAALAPDHFPADAGMEARQLAGALQRMGERMRAFVRRERDFTRDASHELRTPLTVIRVASDLLQNDPDLPQRAQRSLARIQRAGRDMESVIESFLILAREGDIEPQREDFAVRDVVAEEVAKARPLLAGKPVELTLVENADPQLHASPRVFAVMLGNLLANACTFTERGQVEVRIERDRVVVRDTGIGMSADTLQRAFDPFYRADPDNPSGKGMGLSIVRRLGERFGWPVGLDSAPDRGTTATIRFMA